MKIDGQCHCGQVHYTATVDPKNASVCHCTDCQAFSGSQGPKRISLRLGTSNQRAQLPPQRQIWCSSAMPWVEGLADVPKSPAQD
jgi:hypothetical protein